MNAPTPRAVRTPPESERIFVRDGLFHRAGTNRPLEAGLWSYVVDEHGNFFVTDLAGGHRGILGDNGPVAAAGILEIPPESPGQIMHMNTRSGGFPDGSIKQLRSLLESLGLNMSQLSNKTSDGSSFPNSVKPKN
jgi:hypothetical protein